MPSKITLTLGAALAGIALCCFVESSFAQDALIASLNATENDDSDAKDKDDRDDKSGKRRTRTTGSLRNGFLAWPGDNVSLGVTSVGETAEAETVVVTGSPFDLYPVPYPALPPVEGTRINAGKKTSFVKPEEFPTFAGNDWDGAIFAENRFKFGRLSIVPGMRLEFLNQSVDEQLNVAKTSNGDPLANQSDFNFVPLFGLGLGYVLVQGQPILSAPAVAGEKGAEAKNPPVPVVTGFGPPRVELYGTVSQAYRPITYGELVPTGASSVVNGDLQEGNALQFEYGVRGKPFPYLNFDVGGFYFTFTDQIGEVILPNGFTSTESVGDARYIGLEAATEMDILSLINGGAPSPYGNLTLYGNVTLLDAEFTSGPNNGKTPAYAPEYQVKTGAIYSYKNTFKLAMLGTLVDDEFGDDGDSFEGFIPAYNVWDLTAEFRFWKGRAGVFAGIRNVFNESYWGEVREEGIMPALPRNYYGGFEFFF
jgi:outer membrane receptor for Fe3+-dicitrate